MTLLWIVLATLACGIGSVWLAAALLKLRPLAGSAQGDRPQEVGGQSLLSLAAGALLATAFMHLLPEAFESEAGAHELFATLLIGVVFFFLLDKAELWHHGHEHHAGGGHAHGHAHDHSHAHAHGHAHTQGHAHAQAQAQGSARSGGWTILTGDSVHCFGDGILIASAFIADWRLGVVAALAVLAHEVPHHMGDLVVLRQASARPGLAVLKVSLAGAVTALGGLVGFFLVEQLQDYLPYFLVVASSSFVYVALADLIPQLQRHLSMRQTLAQIAWLAAGIVLVVMVSGLAHSH
ncbi:MAG: ZIP family metal transporter [Burkholderiaceae bacterium]